jgi:hypothetical protein
MAENNLDWQNIDPASLPAIRKEQYEAMKVAYRKYAELKKYFEAGMNDDFAMPGTQLKFGYRYGKLSIAVADGDAPRAVKSNGALSLEGFLKAQASAGRAS